MESLALHDEHVEEPMHEGPTNEPLPLWARVVFFLGVPSAIAIYLVYILAQFATVRIEGLTDSMTSMSKQMEATTATLMLHQADAKRFSDEQMRVQTRICWNTSKTEQDRLQCLR